jgi:arylsulfatase A-like enzyme
MAESAVDVRVCVVVCDSLPARWIRPTVTPVLAELALATGGPVPVEGVLSAATYPNHATFATGTNPIRHGVVANDVWDGQRFVPAYEVGPRTDTLFSVASAAGRPCAAVVGDQHLVGVMGLDDASRCWPPQGRVPAGVPTDAYGYVTDAVVVEQAATALDAVEPDLLFVHLNAPDTAAHLYGPDSIEACEHYRATDAALADLVELLRVEWDRTVVVVVNDHDAEEVTDPIPIDVVGDASARGIPWAVVDEGSAAVAHRLPGAAEEPLPRLAGQVGRRWLDVDTAVVWCAPGRWFGSSESGLRGVHGSLRTRGQFAVVAGGHPAAASLAGVAREVYLRAVDWAPTVAGLLGVPLTGADGRDLLGVHR